MRMPAKVLLMRGARNEGNRNEGNRNEGNRNERNRMEGEMNERMEMNEMRRYRRYDDGRFAPRSEYDRSEMYGAEMRGNRSRSEMYDRSETENPRRERGENMDGGYKIGRDDMRMDRNYPMERPYSHKEEIGFRSGKKERGRASSNMSMDEDTAMEWAENMQHADGSKGIKWQYERAEQLMKQVGFQGDPMEFFVILNAMYSDYCKAAKKFGVDRPDFYAELAKAWLDDKDAEDGKAMLYYEYIVKK